MLLRYSRNSRESCQTVKTIRRSPTYSPKTQVPGGSFRNRVGAFESGARTKKVGAHLFGIANALPKQGAFQPISYSFGLIPVALNTKWLRTLFVESCFLCRGLYFANTRVNLACRPDRRAKNQSPLLRQARRYGPNKSNNGLREPQVIVIKALVPGQTSKVNCR